MQEPWLRHPGWREQAAAGASLVKVRILALGGLLVVVAIVALAWIMGDTQPTRWIEKPVAPPSPAEKAGS